jgi:hypothetical protein
MNECRDRAVGLPPRLAEGSAEFVSVLQFRVRCDLGNADTFVVTQSQTMCVVTCVSVCTHASCSVISMTRDASVTDGP